MNQNTESQWICPCGSDNAEEELTCGLCQTARPQQQSNNIQQKMTKKEQNQTQEYPLLLFENKNGQVLHVPNTLTILEKNFDADKPLVVLIAAGLLGTGKSTWLNTILYQLCEQQNKEMFSSFKIGHTAITQTEGLWILPRPLLIDNGQAQLMILDMEGMGGIKQNENMESTQEGLNKLYTIAMMISSAFCIHSNKRFDAGTVETLRTAFLIINNIQQDFQIEMPNIYMFLKDSEEIKNKDEKAGDVKQIIVNSAQMDAKIANKLELIPKPKLPEKFLDLSELDGDNQYHLLKGTKIHEMNSAFLNRIQLQHKRKPNMNEKLLLKDLIRLVETLSSCINQQNFKEYFKGSMNEVLLQIMRPFTTELKESFTKECQNFSNSCDVKKTMKEFQDDADKLVQNSIQKFDQKLLEITKNEIQQLECVSKERQLCVLSLKQMSTLFAQQFNQRKISQEKDAELRKQLEEQQKEIQSHSNKLKMAEEKIQKQCDQIRIEREISQKKMDEAAKNQQEALKQMEYILKDNYEKERQRINQEIYRQSQQHQDELNKLKKQNANSEDLMSKLQQKLNTCSQCGQTIQKIKCNKIFCRNEMCKGCAQKYQKCYTCDTIHCFDHLQKCPVCKKTTCRDDGKGCWRSDCKP